MIPDLKNRKIELGCNTEKVTYVNQTALVDDPVQYSATRYLTFAPLLPSMGSFCHTTLINIIDVFGAEFQRDNALIRALIVRKLTGSKINYQQLRTALLNNDNSVIKVGE